MKELGWLEINLGRKVSVLLDVHLSWAGISFLMNKEEIYNKIPKQSKIEITMHLVVNKS